MNLQETAIGLDIGTSRLVTARKPGKTYQFQTQLNAFLTLPFSKLTEGVLRREDVPHECQDGDLLIPGNESERFANLFRLETRRPMTRGTLNPDETSGLTVIRKIIRSLLGPEEGNGRRLCFSMPGVSSGSHDSLTYHEAAIRSILTEMGYAVTNINEGLAVVLAELEDSNYTGIGISCGGGMCNACLAYLSIPVFSFSVPKGGDFIDSSAASVAGEGATRVRAIKEQSFHFNGFFNDKIQQALSIYYEDMISGITGALKEYLSKAKNVPRLDRPIPIVLSGGSAMPAGFRDRFEKMLAPADLPIAISEVRMATEPLHSTAKGALISALAEI